MLISLGFWLVLIELYSFKVVVQESVLVPALATRRVSLLCFGWWLLASNLASWVATLPLQAIFLDVNLDLVQIDAKLLLLLLLLLT